MRSDIANVSKNIRQRGPVRGDFIAETTPNFKSPGFRPSPFRCADTRNACQSRPKASLASVSGTVWPPSNST
jgi:hypothetical protein